MSHLYIVPTPIGNLEDMTYRGVRVLGEVDLVLAEDTRQTKKLLHHYGIDNALKAYHQHNEHQLTDKLVEELKQVDKTFALVSDAGMPGISDPGFMMVRKCRQEMITVECLPGATAFIPALVQSGIPSDRFIFEGFLPHKKGRNKRIQALKEEKRTIVLYESPYRLVKTLQQLAEAMGPDRQASVSREISKVHEENVPGSLDDLITHFQAKTVKGELVIVVQGKS